LRLTLDTNLLVRAVVVDDEQQAAIARRVLADADEVILTLPALCEFAWVLGRFYKTPRDQIAIALRGLVAAANVVLDDEAVADGLAVLDVGGDFADGVIASLGTAKGAEAFVSFDRRAVRSLTELGISARVPDELWTDQK
jgi:predicted nucleic-acid-binding protein